MNMVNTEERTIARTARERIFSVFKKIIIAIIISLAALLALVVIYQVLEVLFVLAVLVIGHIRPKRW